MQRFTIVSFPKSTGQSKMLLVKSLAVLRRTKETMVSAPAYLVARRDPARKKKNLKEDFFDFKQKKETRRKEINTSQLTI